MTIEKLTGADRLWLKADWCNSQHGEGRNALRIIDALTAENENLTQQNHRLVGRIDELKADDEHGLRAEIERLTEQRDSWGMQARAFYADKEAAEAREKESAQNAYAAIQRAEARLAEATALLGRVHSRLSDDWYDDVDAFLANQPAAPVRCTACQKRQCDGTHVGCPSYLLDQPAAPAIYHSRPGSDVFVLDQPAAPQCSNTEAFLSGDNTGCDGVDCPVHKHNQPAAPARTEAEFELDAHGYQVPTLARLERARTEAEDCPSCNRSLLKPSARTEAEQAVLDACSAWTCGVTEKTPSGPYWSNPADIVRDELARRRLK